MAKFAQNMQRDREAAFCNTPATVSREPTIQYSRAVEVPSRPETRRHGSMHATSWVQRRRCGSSMWEKLLRIPLGACAKTRTLTMRQRALTKDACLMCV